MKNNHSICFHLTSLATTLVVCLLGGCNPSVQTPVQDDFKVSGEFIPNYAGADTSLDPAAASATISSPESEGENVVLLAKGGVTSDVRTTTQYLTGAPTPPNAEELQALGEEIIAALDSGDTQRITQLVSADEAPRDPIPFPQSEVPQVSDSTEENLEPEGTYVFGAGDSFDISVFDTPELSRALTIRPDGFISFPLIREIRAAGKTPSELEAVFEERLLEHVYSPEVTIVVTSVASKSYYVFGAINGTGPYPLFRDTTLLQAILSAGGPISAPEGNGGPVPLADMSRIRVIRNHGNTREVISKNLSGMSAQEMLLYEDIPIQPDDIIYVPSKEDKIVFVFGAVPGPGIIPIRDDTRVLEALLSVGGPIPGAKKEQILVIRPQGNGARYWCVNMEAIERGQISQNILLEGGEIIYVPQKFISKLGEFVQLFASAAGPFMSTYLTAWDAWWVHERFSALRARNFGSGDNNVNVGEINVGGGDDL